MIAVRVFKKIRRVLFCLLCVLTLTSTASAFEGTWRYYTASPTLGDRYESRGFKVCTFDGWTVENSGVSDLAQKWRDRPMRISISDPDMIEKFERHILTQGTFCNAYAVPWGDASKREALNAATTSQFVRLQPYAPINSRISAPNELAAPQTSFSEERITLATENTLNSCNNNIYARRNFDCECIAAETVRRMRSKQISTESSDHSISQDVLRNAPEACFDPQGIKDQVQQICDRSARYNDPFEDCDCAKSAAIDSILHSGDIISLSKITNRRLIPDAFAQCR